MINGIDLVSFNYEGCKITVVRKSVSIWEVTVRFRATGALSRDAFDFASTYGGNGLHPTWLCANWILVTIFGASETETVSDTEGCPTPKADIDHAKWERFGIWFESFTHHGW